MVGLFWNVNRSDRRSAVAELCRDHAVDLLVLAECDIPSGDVVASLTAAGRGGFVCPARPTGAITLVHLFVRHPYVRVEDVFDDGLGRWTIRRLLPNDGPDLLLVAAHLRNKLHTTDSHQALSTTRLPRRIEVEEDRIGHARTVLVGDLNMNPFDAGVVSAECLHGVMTRRIAAGGGRIVEGEHRRYFYNPMWRFQGDHDDGPPGTFYLPAAGRQAAHFWHTYDQVLVRPALVDALGEVRVIDRVGPRSLLTTDGTPDIRVGSDHLPLLFTLHFG